MKMMRRKIRKMAARRSRVLDVVWDVEKLAEWITATSGMLNDEPRVIAVINQRLEQMIAAQKVA